MCNSDVLVVPLRRRICIHSAVSSSADHDQDFMRRGQFDKMTSRSVDIHMLQGRPEHLGEACVCATSAVQTQQGLRASSRNTAAQARFASAQRVIFSTWCWGSPGEKVARKAFELEPSIFLEWRGRSRRHAWSIVLDTPSLFHDMRASAAQCAPTANVGGTRRHRTAEPAHGITLVR